MVRTMKLKLLFSSLCAALVVGLPTAVQAQRLVPSQKGLEVSASVPIVKGKSLFKQDDFGLTLSLSHYLKRGKYTFLSAGYEQQALSCRSYQVPLRDYLVQMGYAHPLLSDKGKNVFFYLGASALVGYEQLNRDKGGAMGRSCWTPRAGCMAQDCTRVWNSFSRTGLLSGERHNCAIFLTRMFTDLDRH